MHVIKLTNAGLPRPPGPCRSSFTTTGATWARGLNKAQPTRRTESSTLAAGSAPAHSIFDSPVGVFSVTVYARTTKLLRETTLDGFALKMRLAPGPLKVAGRLCSEDAAACILQKTNTSRHWR